MISFLKRSPKDIFYMQKMKKRIKYAEAALKKSRKHVPLADWSAGLAAWRLGDIEKAAGHFSQLADTRRISDWNYTAANWWASRAYLKLGDPEKAVLYLQRTAEQPRTFYGLLALRQLGVEKPFNWNLPALSQSDLDWLLKIPSAKRAVALSEIGQFDLAAQELRSAFPSANPRLAPLLLTLSEKSAPRRLPCEWDYIFGNRKTSLGTPPSTRYQNGNHRMGLR